jgi:galactokinase
LIFFSHPERRAECEEAVRLLQKELSIEFLGELDSETFEQYQALIGDLIISQILPNPLQLALVLPIKFVHFL